MIERYQTDETIPIEVLALDASLDPLTGLTDLLLSIRRKSDDFFYDFNDDTFKSTGWTTRQQALSEISAANAPGEYGHDWDTSAITNAVDDDTYMIRVDQSPGTNAANMPQTGEIILGQYVDDIDAAVSSRATQADILSDATPFAGANIDAAISSRSSHSAADVDTTLTASHGAGAWTTADLSGVLSAIAALNDISIADVQTALTNQGYTSLRAGNLDNLDATISSLASAIAALNDLSIADVQTALTNQGYTSIRAALLDNLSDLDASISSVLAAIAGLNDISQADVQAAMTAQGYTAVRAALLDNLDAAISSVLTAIGALNDLSQADVQAALTAQGYTTVRAALLDNLDATISSVISAIAALNDITAADVWAYVLENGETAAWFMRIILAGVAGISSDNGQEFYDLLGTKKRIDGTVSGQDRTAVVLDGTP